MTGQAAAAVVVTEETRTLALLRDVRAGFAPPPDLTVSEFADAELVVTTGSLAGTHW